MEGSRYVRSLVRVEEVLRAVADKERELAALRSELRAALREAHDAGASYAELGRIIGVGRERVRRMVVESD
jgi:DNA-directed RNA polymerase sigma subunit (sigma70/sigma32)